MVNFTSRIPFTTLKKTKTKKNDKNIEIITKSSTVRVLFTIYIYVFTTVPRNRLMVLTKKYSSIICVTRYPYFLSVWVRVCAICSVKWVRDFVSKNLKKKQLSPFFSFSLLPFALHFSSLPPSLLRIRENFEPPKNRTQICEC